MLLYSEIFSKSGTIQGEGQFTGAPSVFLRLAGCNLTCMGFGQKNKDDRSTWVNPYENVDPSKFESIEDLPLFEYGCDTAYAHNPKFKRFFKKGTVTEILKNIVDMLPQKTFFNQITGTDYHLVITGGEPMLQQEEIISLLYSCMYFGLKNVTIETNGTIPLKVEFVRELNNLISKFNIRVLFSISPKLSMSGELEKNAQKPDIIEEYMKASLFTQLKFVVDGKDDTWKEIDTFLSYIKIPSQCQNSVWVMPVGCTKAQQEEIQADICEAAYQRGYNFSARLHNWIFMNGVGK